MPEPAARRDGAAVRAEQAAWMAQIAAGGAAAERAMDQVFDAYRPRTLRRLMAKFRLSEAEAEDVFQDAAIDLWTSAARFDPGADLARWFNTLAFNRARKLLDSAWLRHRVGERDEEGDAEAGEAGPGFVPDGGEGDGEADASDRADGTPAAEPVAWPGGARNIAADECTDEGLARFERRHGQDARWLIARELDRRPIPELAADMRCSEVTARQRLHVLREKLKAFLGRCLGYLQP